LYLQRSDEDASVKTVDIRAIRTDMDEVLTDFYNAFEFCSAEYNELDYQTPANKMNDLISRYKTELKARTTRRHEGKAVHTEAPITVG
jgi:translation elongation factor EF-4